MEWEESHRQAENFPEKQEIDDSADEGLSLFYDPEDALSQVRNKTKKGSDNVAVKGSDGKKKRIPSPKQKLQKAATPPAVTEADAQPFWNKNLIIRTRKARAVETGLNSSREESKEMESRASPMKSGKAIVDYKNEKTPSDDFLNVSSRRRRGVRSVHESVGNEIENSTRRRSTRLSKSPNSSRPPEISTESASNSSEDAALANLKDQAFINERPSSNQSQSSGSVELA